MENDSYKFVEFDKYCPICRYEKLKEDDDPCYECLANTINLYSCKPVNYIEKEA